MVDPLSDVQSRTQTGLLPDVGGIVAGVDGSPSSHLALEWAADTAALYGLPLTVLFARPDAEGDVVVSGNEGSMSGAVQATVAEIKEQHPELDVRGATFPEPPVQSLLRASETADLLVIGSRGWDGFTGLLVGSTTLHVVPYAKCPVVVLHGRRPGDAAAEGPVPHAGEVVVAFDGSVESNAAAALAFRHAAAVGCGVAAITVHNKRGAPTISRVDPVHAPVGSPAIAFWAPLVLLAQGYPDTQVSFWEADGRPGAVLVEQSRGSVLLAFGARGKGGFRGLVMGSVSQQLLAHAQCPVGVLHSTAAEAG